MNDQTLALTSKGLKPINMLPSMMNRHGLVSGATGTGKTVTLQALAEQFSNIGTAVFAADIKGDLSGISATSEPNEKVKARLAELNIADHVRQSFPVQFWDVFGESGTPIRATVSEMGPLLFSRLLNLSDVQEGVLNIVFKYCDDNKLPLVNLPDLRAAVQYVSDNSGAMTSMYGNVSKPSIGAIQRGLLQLESQNGELFFGEPAVKFTDFIRTDGSGKGIINILAAYKLFLQPMLYSTFLLWLLNELYENLPEAGDLDKPKLVFFFDEAHLLFEDAPKALMSKIEQVIRLIRSKGVGVYFVTQNPADIPESVLAQLGNRIQHALRAFTPLDQKGISAASKTFRPNPDFKVEDVITQLGVGEALVSLLDEKGAPSVTERAFIIPPHSQIGAIDLATRGQIINNSSLDSTYRNVVDNVTAKEMLAEKINQATAAAQESGRESENSKPQAPAKRQPKSQGEKMMDAALTTAARTLTSQLTRGLLRGVLGNILKTRI
jgi:uncharacterized protein